MADKPVFFDTTKVMTPEGYFVYPVLITPDTKFKLEGEFKAPIRLSVEDSESLINKYEEVLANHMAVVRTSIEAKIEKATAAEKGKAKRELADLKEADRSYRPAYDDEGNETGEFVFTFKLPARRADRKSGKVINQKPDLFDSVGRPLMVDAIWGGSRGRVAAEFRPFYTAQLGAGLSLRLRAVQITQLVGPNSGPRDAGDYGFGVVEGGFVSSPAAVDSDEVVAGYDDTPVNNDF